jgi:hypothetical protein
MRRTVHVFEAARGTDTSLTAPRHASMRAVALR